MGELFRRIARKSLLSRVCSPEQTFKFFKDGMAVGFSGFTPTSYPKVIPVALAKHVEAEGLQGKLGFQLFCGASMGQEVEDRWANNNMITRRWPYQTGKQVGRKINDGTVDFGDVHLSLFAHNLRFGFYTKEMGGALDLAVVEATEILEDGSIILGGASGVAPEIIERAEKVIIELNTLLPSYRALHDVAPNELPPHRKPYLVTRVDDRIGDPFVRCDPEKIVAIVESREPDNGRPLAPADDVSKRIAGHILDFFASEVRAGRLPANLLPLQSGVGNIANAVVAGFAESQFEHVTVWTEVLQDTMLDFFDSGKLDFASTTALSLSPPGAERFYERWDEYAPKIVIRPQQITNHPEIIRRLGVIGMNTPVEVDMYGHANSTHVAGTKVLNGIGGSGDFLRNAYLSIMHTPSTRPTKTDPTGITCVVPMVTHVDHTEHDLDCIATEQGIADMRGLGPKARAQEVINKIVHPDFKPILQDYFDYACKKCLAAKAGHEPQLLDAVFRMHTNLAQNGTMKVPSFK